ncbi:MAG: triphosphoribosyl-dephospho-CoA synthase [Candidatus Methanospirareceae archaeon]
MDADYVARCASLAMLLEVSAYSKPGNVDRLHDRNETKYEHFLASSVAVYPVLREAASGRRKLGEAIRMAVEESMRWQKGGNTHFGSLLLLIPLSIAAGLSKKYEEIKGKAKEVVRMSTVEDAIELYNAFSKAKVKVKEVEKLSVRNANSIEEIKRKGLTFYDILSISASYDLISREIVGGFEKCFRYADIIKNLCKRVDINEAIMRAYLALLSEDIDTFVEMEFGVEKAKYVRERAKEIVKGGYKRGEIEDFDEELIKEGINPGSSADIIVAALFLAIVDGLRY